MPHINKIAINSLFLGFSLFVQTLPSLTAESPDVSCPDQASLKYWNKSDAGVSKLCELSCTTEEGILQAKCKNSNGDLVTNKIGYYYENSYLNGKEPGSYNLQYYVVNNDGSVKIDAPEGWVIVDATKPAANILNQSWAASTASKSCWNGSRDDNYFYAVCRGTTVNGVQGPDVYNFIPLDTTKTLKDLKSNGGVLQYKAASN